MGLLLTLALSADRQARLCRRRGGAFHSFPPPRFDQRRERGRAFTARTPPLGGELERKANLFVGRIFSAKFSMLVNGELENNRRTGAYFWFFNGLFLTTARLENW